MKDNVIDMSHLVLNVENWSIHKGLNKAPVDKQFQKVVEEVGEIAEGLAKGDDDLLMDGIGDVLVTLIILSQQKGWTIEQCLLVAWNEIKGRKGKMINGVFVKSEDLK